MAQVVRSERKAPVALSWGQVQEEVPEFARQVEERFNKYTHKVLATLRKDGSPRVSGIEARFEDGQLWLGMMPGSAKAMDLRRDPRVALHSGTEDPESPSPGTVFDVKVSGIAVEVLEGSGEAGRAAPGHPHTFRVEIAEVVLVALGDPGDHLVLQIWTPSRGLTSVKRH